jgi:hypothetical protein
MYRIVLTLEKIVSLGQCCGSGSGIRCFFTPRIRNPDPGSGREQWSDPDPGSGISKQNLLRGRIQDPVLFYPPDPDPGWSNGRIRIRDKTSRIRNTALGFKFLN